MAIKRGKLYYAVAHDALEGTEKHPGFSYLKNLVSNTTGPIVDVGCGEGSRLDYLVLGRNGVGVEISQYALNLAKESFPRFKFILQKGGKSLSL